MINNGNYLINGIHLIKNNDKSDGDHAHHQRPAPVGPPS